MSASMKISRFILSGYKATTTNALSLTRGCGCHLLRSCSTVAEVKPRTWQLHSAVCLQRYPVITSEDNEIETKYRDYLGKIELDQSLLSDHELQAKAEMARKKEKSEDSSGTSQIKTRSFEESLLSAEEMEDEWQKEIDKFVLAERLTDADRENDKTSPERKLDKKLVLITKYKWDQDSKPFWIFPQVLRIEGESMREAAERALKTHCGETVQAMYMGNAPCGYHKYNLPPGKGSKGVKLFFFKANYHGGNVALQTDNVLEYKWVALDELQEYFTPTYLDDVRDFLIDL